MLFMSSPTEGRAHAVLRVCSLPYGLRRGASAPRRTQQGRGPWESQLHEMTKPAGTGGRYMKRLASPGAAKTTRMALPQQDPSLTGSAGNISPGASTCVLKRNGNRRMRSEREVCRPKKESSDKTDVASQHSGLIRCGRVGAKASWARRGASPLECSG